LPLFLFLFFFSTNLGFFRSLISIKRPLQRISYSIIKECQDLQKKNHHYNFEKKKDIHYNRHNIHIYKNKKKKKKVELNKFEKNFTSNCFPILPTKIKKNRPDKITKEFKECVSLTVLLQNNPHETKNFVWNQLNQ